MPQLASAHVRRQHPFHFSNQIKRYFVSFWNGVDLRYRLLKGPKIRISIAGIIISRVSTLNCHLKATRMTRKGQQKGSFCVTFCDYVSIILSRWPFLLQTPKHIAFVICEGGKADRERDTLQFFPPARFRRK